MFVPHIGGLEGIGLRLYFEDQVDDVLERQIVRVRTVPAAPAQMIALLIFGDAGERVIDGLDAPSRELAIGLNRGFRLQHVPPIRQSGVVDLQDEARRYDRAVFLAQSVGQSEQEFVLGLVVFVEDEMVEPAGCEHGDKRLVNRRTRGFDRLLERVELAVDGLGSLRSDRAAGDDADGDGRHRLFARD